MKKLIAAAALGATMMLTGCVDAVEQQKREASKLDALVDAFTTDVLKEAPELATSLGVEEARAGGPYNNRLGDNTVAGMDRRANTLRKLKNDLDALDETKLIGDSRVTHDVLQKTLDYALAGVGFGYGDWGGLGASTPYPVTQLGGAYSNVPDFLASTHPMRNAKDAEDYLARVKEFARVVDEETARILDDAQTDKVVPPRFAIDGAINQIAKIAGTPAPQTTVVRAFRERAAQAGVQPVQIVQLEEQITTAMRDLVQPALRRQMEALGGLRAQASDDPGVWRLNRGADYYAAAVKAWTTLDMTPDALHQMGLDLVASLTNDLDAALKVVGQSSGSVIERLQALGKDPAQIVPSTDAGRAALLAELNAQMQVITARMPEQFGALAKLPLEIKRVPPEIEQGAPGGYYQPPSLDGSRPGFYYINLRNPAVEWPRFTLPTLTYHEGTPGHHWQISIAMENTSIPLLRRSLLWFSGYGEGWALYAEQIADEMGMYKNDPAGRVGYLQSMIFRAARLVVDTGIHAKKWSRDQAIDYMVSVTGDSRSSIATEVERYAVWPGQALAYMPGRVVINRLRDKARQALGDRFDIRAFHDLLLTPGARPLSVLEQDVDRWIGAQPTAAKRRAE